jgi:type I site-specific restriction endonuclease
LCNKHNIRTPELKSLNNTDYGDISSILRQLQERDFSRFNDNEEFKTIAEAEKELIKNLVRVKNELKPGYFEMFLEWIYDVWSFISKNVGLSDERSFVNLLTEQDQQQYQL